MTPAAHPSMAVLGEYASGVLRPSFAIVVGAHLETCAACRSQVRVLESACGELVSDLPPAAMGEDALARVMAGIERPHQPAEPDRRTTAERIPFSAWRRILPGVEIRKAQVGRDRDLLYMLRVPAGMGTILHGHSGIEFTTVLKGAFVDDGRIYAKGDFVAVGEALDHHPMVTAEDECICLIASERPMRVRTFIGRVVQLLARV